MFPIKRGIGLIQCLKLFEKPYLHVRFLCCSIAARKCYHSVRFIKMTSHLPKYFILRLPDTVASMIDYFKSEDAIANRKSFNDRILKGDYDEVLSYRLINHWQKAGLLDESRQDSKGWRKYSLIDLLWIRIIVILREFGVSLQNLRKVKQDLLGESKPYMLFSKEHGWMKSIRKDHTLEYAIVEAILRQREFFIIIFQDFTCDVATTAEIAMSREVGATDCFIQISINPLLQALFPESDIRVNKREFEVTDDELAVIAKLRTEDVESISIRKRDGKVYLIESKTLKDVRTPLKDILREGDFQTVEIHQKDGNIASIKQIKKVRIDWNK